MENKFKQCSNCTYFVQHYAKISGSFAKVYCGHCINLNNSENAGIKNNTDICSNYKSKFKSGGK